MILNYSLKRIKPVNLIPIRTLTNSKTTINNFNYENLINYNKNLNCFININKEETILNDLKLSEDRVKRGSSLSELDGVTLAVKDNICVKDLPTTCSSNYLKDFSPTEDATCIRLLKNAGLVILGKTNLDEFGMGSANLYSHFGPCKHPADDNLVPGGSSGGSACAVGANIAQLSLGSDTGGSVRLPASYCGVYGFKPSYGRISRFGLISYANSLDTIGIISSDLELVREAFKHLDRSDPLDATCLSQSVRDQFKDQLDLNQYLKTDNLSDIHVGIPKEYFIEELDDQVKQQWQSSIDKLQNAGAKIVEISLSHTKYALPAYYTIALAEASSNLARYDGIKYGYRTSEEIQNFMEQVCQSRQQSLGEEVQKRILLGTFTLSHGAYDDYFLNAQKVRSLVQKDFDQVFKFNNVISSNEINANQPVDVIITPTTFSPPPRRDNLPKGANGYTNDVFTVPSSLAGLPSISIPTKSSTPIGMQLIGQFGSDELVLKIANYI